MIEYKVWIFILENITIFSKFLLRFEIFYLTSTEGMSDLFLYMTVHTCKHRVAFFKLSFSFILQISFILKPKKFCVPNHTEIAQILKLLY